MKFDRILTDEFKSKIKNAVHEAEKKSGGEIVVFLTPESDSYHEAYWKTGFFTFFIGAFIFIFLYNFFQFVDSHSLVFLSIAFLLPFLLISLLHLIKPLHLLLIGNKQINYYVHLKAREAFLDNEIFHTKDRTGILIDISLFEKKVVVMGDSGINKKVGKDNWDSVIKTIVEGIKEQSLGHGIVSGIKQCGDILKENNVKRRAGDKNELDDSLRVGGVE